jgi:cysteinyl-tRNA synthetase
MQLKLYNGLTKTKEIFTPANKNVITLYVCGPTIYDYIHIGNARSLVVFDILFRALRFSYGKNSIIYVRNITDIDDKINDRAKKLEISIKELTDKTLIDFHRDAEYLKCLTPTHEPKALDHVSEMIKIISILVEKKMAYISGGHVYFDVALCKDYYKLSKKNVDENIAGVRIDIQEIKKHPNDFVLWKPSLPSDDEMSVFDSPWGRGRPGWHIECSAMSHKYLGENFDIHGGGVDLIFPHHTNEIAQSKSAFPNSSHAKYWIHNGFLTVNGQKMSKSLGNFITVQNIRDENIHGEILRFALMNTHYSKPLDYSVKALKDSKENLDYFYRSIQILESNEIIDDNNLPKGFIEAIEDDLNFNQALALIHKLCRDLNKKANLNEKIILAKQIKACGNFLGILNEDAKCWFKNEDITIEEQNLLNERNDCKKNHDWKRADEIREILINRDIIIEDHKDGTSSVRKNTKNSND